MLDELSSTVQVSCNFGQCAKFAVHKQHYVNYRCLNMLSITCYFRPYITENSVSPDYASNHVIFHIRESRLAICFAFFDVNLGSCNIILRFI